MKINKYIIYLTILLNTIAAPISKAQNKISLVRYNDDFSSLKKDTLKKGFDKLKYIKLGENKNLSIGGEIREQFQYYENQNFGDVPHSVTNPNAIQVWQRIMLHTNIELGNKIRLFSQISSTFRFGNPDPLVPEIDENQLSIHQMFIDYKFNEKWLTRIGRQEVFYGNHRLFTFREGPNTRLAFDAVIIKHNTTKRKYDFFVMTPVISQKGIFDDKSFKEVVIGLYTTEKIYKNHIILDSYSFFFSSDKRTYNYTSGNEKRETSGIRLYSENNNFNYEVEANYQKGKFNNQKIKAYSFSADVNHKLIDKNKFIVGFNVNYMSGDKNENDNQLNTYNSIFSKPPFGLVAPIGLSNIINFNPYIKINPTAKSNIYAGTYWLSRLSYQDDIYSPGAGGALETRPNNPLFNNATSKSIGTLFVIESNFYLNKNITFSFDTSYLKSGSYPKETGSGKDILYLSFKSNYKF